MSFSVGQGHGWGEVGPIPDPSDPNNIISPYWADLNPSAGGTISYGTVTGESGNSEFVIEFKEVPHFPDNSPVTFQIILHERSNHIELQYGSAINNGTPHTVGIENFNGTVAMQIANDDTISFENEGILIKNPVEGEIDVHTANVSLGRGQELDKYKIAGEFTLSEFSDGVIDPASEEVTIEVGTYSVVIPANSFKTMRRKDRFEFQGSVDGALVQASIEIVGPLTFLYSVEAHKVDLTDSLIPIEFRLKIGNDVGVTTIPLYGYLRTGKNHNYTGLTTSLEDRKSKRHYYKGHRR